jgi:hypothetical protein
MDEFLRALVHSLQGLQCHTMPCRKLGRTQNSPTPLKDFQDMLRLIEVKILITGRGATLKRVNF